MEPGGVPGDRDVRPALRCRLYFRARAGGPHMTAVVAEAKRKGRSPFGLLALGLLLVCVVVALVIVILFAALFTFTVTVPPPLITTSSPDPGNEPPQPDQVAAASQFPVPTLVHVRA